MAFAVEDFEDLLRLLDEHPEWRERLRLSVLGQDFNNLPAIVGELAEAQRRTEARVEELAEAQRRTEARVEELAEAQRRTEARVEELAEAQRRTEARVEELAEAQRRTEAALAQLVVVAEAITRRMDDMTREFGYMYELFFRTRAPVLFGRWLRHPRAVEVSDLPEFEDAESSGRISSPELDQIRVLDILLAGEDKATRQPAYLAIEVSRTVNRDDVERARDRAAILRKLGLTVTPAVGGQGISEATRAFADEEGVAVVILAAQPA